MFGNTDRPNSWSSIYELLACMSKKISIINKLYIAASFSNAIFFTHNHSVYFCSDLPVN